MTVAELEIAEETEADRVIRWRFEELERAGYTLRESILLGVRCDVDLHRATDLLRRGCPSDTALRILL